MFKFLFLISLLLITSTSQATVVNKIVALVDNEVITQSDIENARKFLNQGVLSQISKNQPRGMGNDALLQHLINQIIFEQEIEKNHISIPESDIDQSIQDVLRQKHLTEAQLKEVLAKEGMSYLEYRKTVQKELGKNQFLQKIIYPRIRITDYDLEDYYKKNPKQFVGYEQIRFFEILLTSESAPNQSVIDLMEQVLAQVQKGENFQVLARKYSKGAFVNKDGDSGLVNADSLRPELLNLLYSLRPGEISPPMPVPNGGVFIFKLVEANNPFTRPLKDIKEPIRQKLIDQRVSDELENYLMEARGHHYVEIRHP